MKGRNGLGLGLKAAAVVALALIGAFLASSQVSAQDEAVNIGRVTVSPGGQGSVQLRALNMDAPGLGAWEIGIFYDPAVVTPVACSPAAGSVCNANFASNQIRVVGASASGHQGDTTLATITFRCGQSEDASALTLSLLVLADATTGEPQDIDADAESGSITCAVGPPPLPTSTPRPGEPTATPMEEEEEAAGPTATEEPSVAGLPTTGTGDGLSGNALGWLIAALAGTGVAAMAGLGALRLRARRT